LRADDPQFGVPLARYRPQLAALADAPPKGPGWVHELKLDGYRIGVMLEAGRPCLQSRRELDWTEQFPEIAAAARALPVRSAILDGEAAVVAADGLTDFQALQNAFERGRGAPRAGVTYFAFDLLHLDGRDLTKLPLIERKALLEQLLPKADPVLKYSPHFEVDGAAIFESARKLGAEGIVSKRCDGTYRGGRSDSWLKVKCLKRQEFVIGGFSEREGMRGGVGGLLLGVHDERGLVFAGSVGTGRGWTAEFLRDVRRGLETIVQAECPYAVPPPREIARAVRWVRPVLVVEVAFVEWTSDGSIRHPTFQGFRKDKDARTVVREHSAR
jgi:bifunctional non-homologous end joining protein LigD